MIRTFIALVQKEFLHILRDKRTLIVLFGMPVAQVILFGYAINTEINHARMGVLDRSRDDQSVELIQRFSVSDYFHEPLYLDHLDQIEDGFRSGQVKMVVVIGPELGKGLIRGSASIQIVTDASDPNMASVMTQYAQGIIGKWLKDKTNGTSGPQGIITTSRMHYNPEMRSVNLFVPGVITVILMLVSAMLTSIAISREKELGTMEILLVSPLRPGTIILGKVIPYLVLSLVNAIFIFLIGQWIFHVPMQGSYGMLILSGLIFISAALSLGLLISSIARTQQLALMLSLFALMMPTILLSGFIFPVSSMPIPLQVLANIMPAKHFIVILRGIMLKGVGMEFLWKEVLILTGMSVILLFISVRKFKIRLQ